MKTPAKIFSKLLVQPSFKSLLELSSRVWTWYLLAASCWLGASLHFLKIPFALILGGFLIAMAIIFFSHHYTHSWIPILFSVALILFLLSGFLANLKNQPMPIEDSQVFEGRLTLVSDPKNIGTGIKFLANLRQSNSHKNIFAEVTAYGGIRHQIDSRLAGEWVLVSGRLRPPSEERNYKNVEARLQVNHVYEYGTGAFHTRLANGIRRTIESGASSMTPSKKALFTGITYGDDRNQSTAQREIFRSTGLTHILAVSGQNVAFLLAIFYPLMRVLPKFFRWLLFVFVMGIFITMTRFEPSVLRAATVATLAFFALTEGKLKRLKPKSLLAIAAIILILISPQIVFSLAFQLSITAAAGITFLASPLSRNLFGPKYLRVAMGVTISAQLSVAPLIIANFGAIAIGSLPANILALPAVAGVNIWGMTAGPLAGLTGFSFLHLPTSFMLGWIEGVANLSSGFGWLSHWHIILLMTCFSLVIFLPSRFTLQKSAFASVAALVFLAPVLLPIFQEKSVHEFGAESGSATYFEKQKVLVVKEPKELLGAIRHSRLSQIDLLIFKKSPSNSLVETLAERYKIRNIWVPVKKYIAGATSPKEKIYYEFSGLTIFVASNAPMLELEICEMKNSNLNGGAKYEPACYLF